MKHFYFVIIQALLILVLFANEILYRAIKLPFLSNKLISLLIYISIGAVTIYFIYKFYDLIKTKLRYKILLHIAAFIIVALAMYMVALFS